MLHNINDLLSPRRILTFKLGATLNDSLFPNQPKLMNFLDFESTAVPIIDNFIEILCVPVCQIMHFSVHGV